MEWQRDEGEFVDPCDGTVVPADGEGLLSYPVEVTEDGGVIVDLNPDDDPQPTMPSPPRRSLRRPPSPRTGSGGEDDLDDGGRAPGDPGSSTSMSG